MLKIKGWLRAAALCVAFCLLLTGCSIPMPEETVQVEELLRAPRLAGDYGALQTALNDWLGAVSYTHLRAHETDSYLVCRLLLEKKKYTQRPVSYTPDH